MSKLRGTDSGAIFSFLADGWRGLRTRKRGDEGGHRFEPSDGSPLVAAVCIPPTADLELSEKPLAQHACHLR